MQKPGRQWGWVALAMLAIAVATLRPIHVPYPPTPLFCIVCGSLGGVDVLLNVVLFIPLGAALRAAGLGRGRGVLAGLVATLIVETLQATVIPGRDAALGDVVMNTLGTLVGFELARTWRVWLLPDRRTAVRLATAASVAWLGILATTLQLMRPAAPVVGSLAIDPRPASEFLEPFEGEVLSLALNGRPLDATNGAEIDAEDYSGPVLDVTLRTTGNSRTTTGAIVRISEVSSDNEFAMLARRSDAVTFRPRTRGMDLRLRGPLLELPGVFPATDSGTTTDVHVRAVRTGWTLRAEASNGASSRTDLRASHGWTLIAPFAVALDRRTDWPSAAWMAALSLPLGLWVAAALSARSAGRLLAAFALIAPSGLVGIPMLFGAPWSTWSDVAGVALGLGFGAWCARRFVRSERYK